jgi:bacillithiol biosynthesis deacetylase BshB1
MMDQTNLLDILAIGVHPDDVELGAGGTLLKLADQGYRIGILDLTQGELGTRGSAALRLVEAEQAKNFLGAVVRENLSLRDGFFQYDEAALMGIIRVLRTYRPEVVLCNTLSDRHPDHGRAAKLEADACFYSGLRKIETWGANQTPQQPWRPRAVYHYLQDIAHPADFVVDITGYLDKKIELVLQYSSQFYDPTNQEPATPISGDDFLENLRAKASVYGRPAGFRHGEGFQVARTPGVENLMLLK